MYHSNGIQDTNLFLFSDNICSNPSLINQDFSYSSLLNVFPSPHLVNFNDNDNTMFLQDFHDVLHRKIDDREIVTLEGASSKNSNAKKKKLPCGGTAEFREIKRRCNKDRHSKITTANGSSRGRRMRLSLNVAKEFFSLQDMLGHDKASQTVEWLLKNSENAIKEETKKRVKMSHSPCPSTSVLSAIEELEPEASTKEGTQKISAAHPVKRGLLREKARARARERTQEKKRLELVGYFNDNNRSRLYNCSQRMNFESDYPFLSCEKPAEAGNKALNMSINDPAPVFEVEDLLNYSKQQPQSFEGSTNTEDLIIDHSFFVCNNLNPYTVFNLHQ